MYVCVCIYRYVGIYVCMYVSYVHKHTHTNDTDDLLRKKTKLKNSKSRYQKKETISFRTRQVIIAR